MTHRSLGLPRPAAAIVGSAAVGGLTVLGITLADLASRSALTSAEWAVVGAVGALLTVSWLWPLRVSVGRESRTVHFDDYCLVVLLLLVPPPSVVVTFLGAAVLSQMLRRRPVVKSVFNAGQVVLSVGAAAAVYRLMVPASLVVNHNGLPAIVAGDGGFRMLAAATVAAVAYMVVNSGSVIAVMSANGTPWHIAVDNGLDLRFAIGSVLVALTTAIVVSASPWLIPLAVVPPLILRRVLAEQFEARRDRARVRGLFDATLEANRSMGEREVTDALLSSARTLFSCTEASLEHRSMLDSALQARIPGKNLWLTISGRVRTEPYGKADQSLLDALAAVGAGALSNARLYEEGRRDRNRLSAITSSMGEGVCAVSEAGEITFVNPAACSMLGWREPGSETPDTSKGRRPLRSSVLEAPNFLLMAARRCLSSQSTVTSYDSRFIRSDGSSFHVAYTASPIVDADRPSGAVIVFRDITERKEFEEQLARHAFHDSLTGLPNRRLFLDHLDHTLRRATRSQEVGAVLFADVDRFKLINDSLGHNAGDHLLIAIAQRLRACLRPGDMLARFGGDEFTILLEQIAGADDAAAVARRIIDEMARGVTLPDGHEVVASLSIGIALTVPGKSRDDLLHDADVAMYRTKGGGRRGQFELFDEEAMGVRSAERIELESSLRRAIQERQLEVYYQPLYDLLERKIVGAEALVRWNHPERGMLPPEKFIGLAEDSGLILPLGRQVLEDACRQARHWYERYGLRMVVSVNLSARQFQQAALVDEVEEVLRTTGVDATQLSLEVTESLAMDDAARTRQILLALKALGVGVAIDDFGTGHSALGYLTQFPVDVVKIDRSFVEGVEVDPVKSAIVAAVINLSRAIGSTAVVEGVETREQLDHLETLGCSEGQGFYLAGPMPARALDELLRIELGFEAPVPNEQTTVSALAC